MYAYRRRPTEEDPHVSAGKLNALASLGDSVYIELIGPDPNQVVSPMGSGNPALRECLASLTNSQQLAYAIRCDDLNVLSKGLGRFGRLNPSMCIDNT